MTTPILTSVSNAFRLGLVWSDRRPLQRRRLQRRVSNAFRLGLVWSEGRKSWWFNGKRHVSNAFRLGLVWSAAGMYEVTAYIL